MSFIDDIIRRSRESSGREEDYSNIYYEGGEDSVLEEGEYCGYVYKIESTSRRPIVRIKLKEPGEFKLCGEFINLQDRNGDEKIFEIYGYEIIHNYNFGGDFILNYRNGKKYTINELREDTKAFIDSYIKRK